MTRRLYKSQNSSRPFCQPADLGVVMHGVLICFWRKFEMTWKGVLSRTTKTAFELDRIKLVLLHYILKEQLKLSQLCLFKWCNLTSIVKS